jgi:hypothetical protein
MSERQAETHRPVYRTGSLNRNRYIYKREDRYTLDNDGKVISLGEISTSYRECPTCNGTGRIPDKRVTLPEHEHDGPLSVVVCPGCKGKGTAYDELFFRGNV